jgi:hypothetical protein
MNGIWVITTVLPGLFNIRFGNLFSGAEFDCGEETVPDNILAHCVNTGSGTFEPIFFDGNLVGWIHPQVNEEFNRTLPCIPGISFELKA